MSLLIENKGVLMSANPVMVTKDRLEVIRFSETIDVEPNAVMYRRPRELSRSTLFIEPFSPLASTWQVPLGLSGLCQSWYS